jgi:hypothetical protein
MAIKSKYKRQRTPSDLPWKSRIVESKMMRPSELEANPENWRTHPRRQMRALTSILDEVGWVTRVIYNQRTKRMIDGHARVELALAKGEAEIPVDIVDLSEREERLVLLTLDPSGALAGHNDGQLEALMVAAEQEMGSLLDDVFDLEAVDDNEDEEDDVKIDQSFQLVVTVENEKQQLELIEYVQSKGYKCRALI